MKATLLFSAIFYLIGLKIGHTVENILKSLIPSRPAITAPLIKKDTKEENEKTYFFRSEPAEKYDEADKKEMETKSGSDLKQKKDS